MRAHLRMFVMVFQHEGHVLLADRTLWLVCALFLMLIGYGLFNGIVDTAIRDRTVSQLIVAQETRQVAIVAQLRRIMSGAEAPVDPFANPVDPASVGGRGRYAVMPTAPLAPIAFGQSDLFPSYYRVNHGSKINFMDDGELENPWNLLSGRFDLAFVLTYLFPLLIFALSYNVLSGEREQGTLRLLLSQALALRVLVLGKVAVRATALLACAVVVPCVVLLIARPESRAWSQVAPLASWVGLVWAYGLFWFAVAVAANALGRSSAANALMLVGSWVVLVLVLPVVLNLLVSTASPAPSRTELATRTRLITIDGLNRYNDLLSTDYRFTNRPDLLLPKDGKIDVPARIRALYLLSKDVDDQIQGELQRFEVQLAGQQTLVNRYGIVSPAIVFYEGMAALAGNGSQRYLHFHDQVDRFHRAWKKFFEPKILNGTAITESDFPLMPRFVWQEGAAGAFQLDLRRRVLQILFPAVLLAGIGMGWLRKYRAV